MSSGYSVGGTAYRRSGAWPSRQRDRRAGHTGARASVAGAAARAPDARALPIGKQADALEVYRQGRRLLSEELGLEPSDSLQQLQRAILKHDPKLEPTPAPTHVPSASRRGRAIRLRGLAAATLTVGAIALAISVFAGGLTRCRSNAPAVVPNSLVDLIRARARSSP